jgi:hypothetical protein
MTIFVDRRHAHRADPRAMPLDLGDAAEEESLYDRVKRATARWHKRVMYDTPATPTQKCFAYAIADHLNCVTLDAWPSQERVANLLGYECVKTVMRAARGLERLEVLRVAGGGVTACRYAPVFLPSDGDKIVRPVRQQRPRGPDSEVQESLLPIHIKSSSSTKRLSEEGIWAGPSRGYSRHQRGEIEMQLIRMLGSDGMEILSRLGAIDDGIVERLCRAHAEGRIGERELAAARLAVEQTRR